MPISPRFPPSSSTCSAAALDRHADPDAAVGHPDRAYASHGDTRHVLLFPEDPKECFEFAAQAFDLAERLQTPVFVMEDLDIGMNEWLCEPLPGNLTVVSTAAS